MAPHWVSLCAALFLNGFSIALPQVSLPINAQLPPVARIHEHYQFQFAQTTFTTSSSSDAMVYSLRDAPDWLKLDSESRTFSGTPSVEDVGDANFVLSATDNDGFTTLAVTFVVVDFDGPQLVGDVSQQLSQSGSLSGPTSLALYTGAPFQLQFTTSTFTQSETLSYYATSADRSPLPSWVTFDGASLMFSGVAPALIYSPQSFGIRLIASDVAGFSGASFTFNLVVNDHQLIFMPLEQDIRAEVNTPIDAVSLRDKLLLDGTRIVDSNLKSATAIGPEWIEFDPETLIISGTPSPGSVSEDMTVTASDIYGDQAEAIVHFLFDEQLFKDELGVLNATAGEPFVYHISRSVFTTNDLKITIDAGVAGSWLHFDEQSLALHGYVPADITPGTFSVQMDAKSISSSVTESQTFQIHIYPEGSNVPPNSTPLATRAASTETAVAPSTPTAPHSSESVGEISTLKRIEIAIAVVVPILFVTILVLLLCCWRKSQRNRRQTSNPLLRKLQRTLGRFHRRSRDASEDTEKCEGDSAQASEEITQPGRNGDGDMTSLSSWNYAQNSRDNLSTDSNEALTGRQLGVINVGEKSVEQATAGVDEDAVPGPSKDRATRKVTYRSSRVSERSAGLPVNRRLSGLGHGRSSYESPARARGSPGRRQREDRRSYASHGSQSSQDRINSFPKVPRISNRATKRDSAMLETPTIRSVQEQGDGATRRYAVDRRSFETRRRSYLSRRRSSGIAKNPFFASGCECSRDSSYSKHTPLANRSYNSQRLGHRSHTTRSESSSIGIGVSDMYPRVIREYTESSIRSSELWETASSSHYSDGQNSDNEDEQEQGILSDAGRGAKTARAKGYSERDLCRRALGDHSAGLNTTKRHGSTNVSRPRSLPPQRSRLSTIFPNGSEIPQALEVHGRRVGSIGNDLSGSQHGPAFL